MQDKKIFDFKDNKYIRFPTYSQAEQNAAQTVIQQGLMSGLDISKAFEEKFAHWIGTDYAVTTTSGTVAMLEALWSIGIGSGDEIIAPVMTYWASVFPAYILGAKVRFVDIESDSLCLDPQKLLENITSKTRAIIVVHLYGYPAKMEEIIKIANEHKLLVVEDFSHSHGSIYKKNKTGSLGDIGIASCMSLKSLPLGECGIICTNSKLLFEKCLSFGHYRRLGVIEDSNVLYGEISNENLQKFIGAPIGCIKNRVNQVSTAIGLERLDYFDDEIETVQKSINLFLDLVEKECDCFVPHKVPEKIGSMGGWYSPKAFYISKFHQASEVAAALKQRGYDVTSGHKYYKLNQHVLSSNTDFFREGVSEISIKTALKKLHGGSYPNTDQTNQRLISIPRFVKFNRDVIQQYAKIYIDSIKEVEANERSATEYVV